MTDRGSAEYATRSEEALHGTLDVVRREPPVPGVQLTTSIARTLRWQALLVLPLAGASAIVGGLTAGFRALFGSRRRK